MLITPLDKWICGKLGFSQLSSDELCRYRLGKLRENVCYARAQGKFYREKLRDFGDVVSFDDFEKLPFTMPEDVSQNPHDFLCVPLDDISRIVTLSTSGSTGKNKRLFFTSEDLELTIDFFHHGMSTFTAPGDRVMIFMPGQSAGGVCDLLVRGLGRLGANSFVYGAISDFGDARRAALDFCPTVLVGLPKQMNRLAEESMGDLCLKSVLLASDFISPSFVSAIEGAWSCKVFMHYGLTESGLGGAVSCAAHEGYHMREADLYFEIIDPVSGEVLPSGELGEIVFSTLTRKGMPLIRYRTGDISRIIAGRCACGSAIRRFDQIADRGVIKGWGG
ncbi:MAG: AMP-binding protein [Oscillospiraceae bacterium]|nr:AMP-binding protein [Oscillospiraceae bacterium]